MSNAVPTKREYAPNSRPGKGLVDWAYPMLNSTVGMKAIVAVTGLALIGFVIGHMVGHLKMFSGQEDYNKYAKFLKDTGPLLWIARGGLVAFFVLHILCTIRLKLRSKAARPVPYAYSQTIQASTASRAMMWLGLTILAFVVFHLLHFTLGSLVGIRAFDPVKNEYVMAHYLDVVDKAGRHDVYALMIDAFRNPLLVAVYLVAMFALWMHLTHGIRSVFQTLGLNTPRTQSVYNLMAQVLSVLIVLGYSAVVIGVLAGAIPAPEKTFLQGL